ncbi:MAG TPA: TRAP transporter substrate-binding protein DctP [Stellaceae bacterium]
MTIDRRAVLGGLVAAPAIISAGARWGHAAAPKVLKISHQFPGGTIDEGDFRDRLCQRFAQEVQKRTNGELKLEVYANSSLMKVQAQFSSMRKGALDMSLYPLPYAGGEVPEANLGLMPCLVTTYEQGLAWKKAEIGQELIRSLDSKGIKIITWVWQAGGIASRGGPIVRPDDVKGVKIRGGSREFDIMLKAAGGTVISMPSNELYASMQTGAADAVVTSSTSLISFKLEEVSKSLTTGRGRSFWFMLEPLMMSKAVFDSLTPAQQKVITSVGQEMEAFGMDAAKKDDELVAQVHAKAGVKVVDFDNEALARWRDIARDTAWKDFAERTKDGQRWLKLAETAA